MGLTLVSSVLPSTLFNLFMLDMHEETGCSGATRRGLGWGLPSADSEGDEVLGQGLPSTELKG